MHISSILSTFAGRERELLAHSRGIIMLRGGFIRLAVFSTFIRYFRGFFVPLLPKRKGCPLSKGMGKVKIFKTQPLRGMSSQINDQHPFLSQKIHGDASCQQCGGMTDVRFEIVDIPIDI